MSEKADGVRAEATGETVGEAKWAALRELEQLVPGLDRESVRFQVLSEGERGLLGVGYVPAHVIAHAAGGTSATTDESEAASSAREFVTMGIILPDRYLEHTERIRDEGEDMREVPSGRVRRARRKRSCVGSVARAQFSLGSQLQ